jgi:hypothetical protein
MCSGLCHHTEVIIEETRAHAKKNLPSSYRINASLFIMRTMEMDCYLVTAPRLQKKTQPSSYNFCLLPGVVKSQALCSSLNCEVVLYMIDGLVKLQQENT